MHTCHAPVLGTMPGPTPTPPPTPPPSPVTTTKPKPAEPLTCDHSSFSNNQNTGRCFDWHEKECSLDALPDLCPNGLLCCPGGTLSHFATKRPATLGPGETAAPTPPPPVRTPAPTPPPVVIVNHDACKMVRFTDAPDTHDHLERITFDLLPKSRWGSRRDCEYKGQKHVCPVYLSRTAMPHLGPNKLPSYISLWHDTAGAWVMTWAVSRDGSTGPPRRATAEKRATDQANFRPPYGTHAASGNTKEIDVSKAPGWPGGAKFCCDGACNSVPPPTPRPPPGPTPPPTTLAPTTTKTTITTTRTTWENGGGTATTTKEGETRAPVTTNPTCAECTTGSGNCMRRVVAKMIICKLYSPGTANCPTGGYTDCTKGAQTTLKATAATAATTVKATAATSKATLPPLGTTVTKARVTVTRPPVTTTKTATTRTTLTTRTTTVTTVPVVKDGSGAMCGDGYRNLVTADECAKAAAIKWGSRASGPRVMKNRNDVYAAGCFYYPNTKAVYLYETGDPYGEGAPRGIYLCALEGAKLETTTTVTRTTTTVATPPPTTSTPTTTDAAAQSSDTTPLATERPSAGTEPGPSTTAISSTCGAGSTPRANAQTGNAECVCALDPSNKDVKCRPDQSNVNPADNGCRTDPVVFFGMTPTTYWVDGECPGCVCVDQGPTDGATRAPSSASLPTTSGMAPASTSTTTTTTTAAASETLTTADASGNMTSTESESPSPTANTTAPHPATSEHPGTPVAEAVADGSASGGVDLWIIIVCVAAACALTTFLAATLYRKKRRHGQAVLLDAIGGDIAVQQTTDVFQNPMFSTAAGAGEGVDDFAAVDSGVGEFHTHRRSTQCRDNNVATMPNAIYASGPADACSTDLKARRSTQRRTGMDSTVSNAVYAGLGADNSRPVQHMENTLYAVPMEAPPLPTDPATGLPYEVPLDPSTRLPYEEPLDPETGLPYEIPRDPATGLPYEIPLDPATGLPYEVARDEAGGYKLVGSNNALYAQGYAGDLTRASHYAQGYDGDLTRAGHYAQGYDGDLTKAGHYAKGQPGLEGYDGQLTEPCYAMSRELRSTQRRPANTATMANVLYIETGGGVARPQAQTIMANAVYAVPMDQGQGQGGTVYAAPTETSAELPTYGAVHDFQNQAHGAHTTHVVDDVAYVTAPDTDAPDYSVSAGGTVPPGGTGGTGGAGGTGGGAGEGCERCVRGPVRAGLGEPARQQLHPRLGGGAGHAHNRRSRRRVRPGRRLHAFAAERRQLRAGCRDHRARRLPHPAGRRRRLRVPAHRPRGQRARARCHECGGCGCGGRGRRVRLAADGGGGRHAE